MPIEFQNNPLDWGVEGVEPSTEKKAQGFANGEAPAAGHWDYKFHHDFLVQKELQEKVSQLSDQGIDTSTLVTEEEFTAHQTEKVSDGEVHGLRVTDGKLEFYDGVTWQRVRGDGYPVGNVSGLSITIGNGSITIKWKDPDNVTVTDSNGTVITIAKWKNTKLVRKIGSFPSSENDGIVLVNNTTKNNYQTSGFVDSSLTNGTTYYYMLFPISEEDVVTVDNANRISATPQAYDDLTGSPGPKNLIAGTMQEGYFGAVPASSFITGDSLASAVGLSAGTSQNSTTDWLKFAYKGKILFVAKKPIRYNLSWDSINTANVVTGAKTTTIQGLSFKVRLFNGALTNPSSTGTDKGAKGSEWNRLMLPIHAQAADKSWAYPDNVESDIPNWGIGFTDADLLTHNSYGNGSYSWCQEVYGGDSAYRVLRGDYGVSYSIWSTSSSPNTYCGWRPVLELV